MNKAIKVRVIASSLLVGFMVMGISCSHPITFPINATHFTPTPTSTVTQSTPSSTVTVTITATATPTHTVGVTPSVTPGTSANWDDFDEAPWAQPIPAYLYGPSPGAAYEQNASDVIKYNTTNGRNGSVGALEDDITFNGSNPLEEIAIYNGISYGAQQNVQFGGANPNYFSAWFYSNDQVVINKAYFYENGYVIVTAAPLPVTIPSGVWTKVICYCPTSPAMTTVAQVAFDIIPPSSYTTGPYAANVLIDDISFYP